MTRFAPACTAFCSTSSVAIDVVTTPVTTVDGSPALNVSTSSAPQSTPMFFLTRSTISCAVTAAAAARQRVVQQRTVLRRRRRRSARRSRVVKYHAYGGLPVVLSGGEGTGRGDPSRVALRHFVRDAARRARSESRARRRAGILSCDGEDEGWKSKPPDSSDPRGLSAMWRMIRRARSAWRTPAVAGSVTIIDYVTAQPSIRTAHEQRPKAARAEELCVLRNASADARAAAAGHDVLCYVADAVIIDYRRVQRACPTTRGAGT